MEYQELSANDALLPTEAEYIITVDATETQLINSVRKMRDAIAANHSDLPQAGDLFACNFSGHLYQPLFFVRKSGNIAITPVALNESEFTFVTGLKDWCERNAATLEQNQQEIFILRNMSRGKGLGFFEAGGFYPDFIRWDVIGDKQYVSFIEPHGIMHEGIESPKVQFHKQIKDIEKRLDDPSITLNSFILSWSLFRDVAPWGTKKQEFEARNVLFMRDDPNGYLDMLQEKIISAEIPPLNISEITEHSYLGSGRATLSFAIVPHSIVNIHGLTDSDHLDIAMFITASRHLFALLPQESHQALRTALRLCGIPETIAADQNAMKRDVVRELLIDNGMRVDIHSHLCSIPDNFNFIPVNSSAIRTLVVYANKALEILKKDKDKAYNREYQEQIVWYESEIAI